MTITYKIKDQLTEEQIGERLKSHGFDLSGDISGEAVEDGVIYRQFKP